MDEANDERWPGDHDSLGRMEDHGVRALAFHCLKRACVGRRVTVIDIHKLIMAHGRQTKLPYLAMHARCRECGGIGAHVQPATPRAGWATLRNPLRLEWPWTGVLPPAADNDP